MYLITVIQLPVFIALYPKQQVLFAEFTA